MAGSFTFHNKLHRASHHTLSGTGLPDAGLDPIASESQPFLGTFYALLQDSNGQLTIKTNSYQWWSVFTTVSSTSAIWAPTLSLYNTVNSLSSSWTLGYSGYLSYRPASGLYTSVYTTVCAFSGEWNSPYIMFTNVAQEYTASKTFSGTNLKYNGVATYQTNQTYPTVDWDLDRNQVTFVTLTANTIFNNPTNMRRGGIYTLNITQSAGGNCDALFRTAYRFNSTIALTGVISLSANSRTIIHFVSDGNLMYGDRTYYIL